MAIPADTPHLRRPSILSTETRAKVEASWMEGLIYAPLEARPQAAPTARTFISWYLKDVWKTESPSEEQIVRCLSPHRPVSPWALSFHICHKHKRLLFHRPVPPTRNDRQRTTALIFCLHSLLTVRLPYDSFASPPAPVSKKPKIFETFSSGSV